MAALLAILAIVGIPTVAALTTGSALSMAVAWSAVGGLAINAVKVAEQLPPLPPLPLRSRSAKRGSMQIVAHHQHDFIQKMHGGPLGFGRSPAPESGTWSR
jgi:hypothetical protein